MRDQRHLSLPRIGRNPRVKIESERITCVLPTMNRKGLLEECLSAYGEAVKCPTRMYVVDSSSSKEVLSQQRASTLIGPRHTVTMLYDNPRKRGGVGAARAYGCRVAFEKGRPRTEFLLNMDDDVILKPDAVERMVAVLKQVPEIGSVGAMFGLVRYMKLKGRKPNSVLVSFTHVGSHFLIRSCIARKTGFNASMRLSEDYDMLMNAWDQGYCTALVDSPAVHKKSEDSTFLKEKGNWYSVAKACVARHPSFRLWHSADGLRARIKLKPEIKYPKERFELDLRTLRVLPEINQ